MYRVLGYSVSFKCLVLISDVFGLNQNLQNYYSFDNDLKLLIYPGISLILKFCKF